MFQKIPLLFLGSFIFSTALGQTGPAGVSTNVNNVLWLKADQNVFVDAGVTPCVDGNTVRQWNDASGNADHAGEPVAGQRPAYRVNILNGNPVLVFDGVDDRILSTTVGTGSSASIFVVARYTSLAGNPNPGLIQGSPAGSAFTTTATDKSIGMWVSTTAFPWGRGVQTNNTQCNITQTTTLTANTPYILLNRYNGAGTINQYISNAAAGSVAYNNTLKSWADFGIGRQGAESWNGAIAEVIAFNISVNEAQRIIIDNYLSSKYDITLGSNDVYAGDTPGNSDYDRGVTGIGQSAGTTQTVFAPSVSAGIGFTSTGGLANGDFLMMGYKSTTNWEDVGDIGGLTGAAPARWLRDWYFDVTNGGANLTGNIVFDMSDGGVAGVALGAAANYSLLYRAGTSGNWTEIVASASSVAGDQINFNGVTLTNDGYYTVGTHDRFNASLPIELKTFYAVPQGNSVLLHWESATETNNKEYTIYKSKNGTEFEELAVVPTKAIKGNSLVALSYDHSDDKPLVGTSYYRLKQTDYNGKSELFSIISVDYEGSRHITFTVYPNPNQGQFTVDFTGIENNHEIAVIMYDLEGKLVYERSILSESMATNTFSIIPAQQIRSGVYMVNFVVEGVKYPMKVIVQ